MLSTPPHPHTLLLKQHTRTPPLPPFSHWYISSLILSLVGCTLTQTDTTDLKYLYEGHEDFSVIPTFGVIAAQVGTYVQL